MPRPSPEAVTALERVIVKWIKGHPEDQRAILKTTWGTGLRTLKRHPRYAVAFSVIDGFSGYTQRSKGDVYLAHYQRQGHSLGRAMLRWMAYRLWAELRFWTPPGKTNRASELTRWTNIHAGRFVTIKAAFKKVIRTKEVIGVERKWWMNSAEPDAYDYITETREKLVHKKRGMSGIRRCIGGFLKGAVEKAMGKRWVLSPTLLEAAEAELQRIERQQKAA